jgi:hypothetical protein
MIQFLRKWTPTLYQIGFILLVVMMPFSNLGMSVGSFWILGAWFFDLISRPKQTPFIKWRRGIGLLLSIYALHVIALIYTEDFAYAFRDLRIKLPLLLFPVVLASMRPLERSFKKWFNLSFLIALSLATIICLVQFFRLSGKGMADVRSISIFISHIRFSLLLVLGFAMTIHLLSKKQLPTAVGIAFLFMFFAFLWVAQSVTGLLILGVILIYTVIRVARSTFSRRKKTAVLIGIPLVLLCIAGYTMWVAGHYFQAADQLPEPLDTHSPGGEVYFHATENHHIENGERIWLYVAENELRAGWNARSSMPCDSLDARGQIISGTLIRYMTSLGLRKDADGLAQLSAEDQFRIEQGIPSVLEGEQNAFNSRLNQVLFELNAYMHGGNPNGKSLAQRLEYWKASSRIIQEHPILGVGTGDVPKAFERTYIDMNSELEQTYRLRAHNQYLTIWVAFGLLGLMIFVSVWVSMWKRNEFRKHYIPMCFLLITCISFLSEDTLETQAGVTFVAFFASLYFLDPFIRSSISAKTESTDISNTPS